MQGLPTLKSYGQGKAWGERLAERARKLSDNTFWVLSVSLLTRGITDLGVALGAALALTLGAWRVAAGDMSVEALLIVLMAGTEIFRPLRDLRSVLHQGMLGQSAAASIHMLMDARPLTRRCPPTGPPRHARAHHRIRQRRLHARTARAPGPELSHRRRRTGRRGGPQRRRQVHHRAPAARVRAAVRHGARGRP